MFGLLIRIEMLNLKFLTILNLKIFAKGEIQQLSFI